MDSRWLILIFLDPSIASKAHLAKSSEPSVQTKDNLEFYMRSNSGESIQITLKYACTFLKSSTL